MGRLKGLGGVLQLSVRLLSPESFQLQKLCHTSPEHRDRAWGSMGKGRSGQGVQSCTGSLGATTQQPHALFSRPTLVQALHIH